MGSLCSYAENITLMTSTVVTAVDESDSSGECAVAGCKASVSIKTLRLHATKHISFHLGSVI